MSNINEQKIIIESIKNEISILEKKLFELKEKFRKNVEIMQNICSHEFKKECINDGCYREYAYICTKCNINKIDKFFK